MSDSENLYWILVCGQHHRLQAANAASLREFGMRQLYSIEVRQGMLEPEAETQTHTSCKPFTTLHKNRAILNSRSVTTA